MITIAPEQLPAAEDVLSYHLRNLADLAELDGRWRPPPAEGHTLLGKLRQANRNRRPVQLSGDEGQALIEALLASAWQVSQRPA